jgi:hypothetical protein
VASSIWFTVCNVFIALIAEGFSDKHFKRNIVCKGKNQSGNKLVWLTPANKLAIQDLPDLLMSLRRLLSLILHVQRLPQEYSMLMPHNSPWGLATQMYGCGMINPLLLAWSIHFLSSNSSRHAFAADGNSAQL